MKLSDGKDIDINDFHSRWTKARVSAIYKANNLELEKNPKSEEELVGQFFSDVNPEKKDVLLKNIFDHSRALAASFSKFLGLTFEIEDFQKLLENSDIPCVQGKWESRETSKTLSRSGCDFCPKAGASACDYWREALDGLVMGLGEKERLARHESVRHGDQKCIDVIFFEIDSRKKESQAFGPLPEHMSQKISEICLDFENKMKTSVEVKGLSEGILYFEFKASTDNLCGGTNLLTYTFQRKIQKVYPGIALKEISPRAVLGVES